MPLPEDKRQYIHEKRQTQKGNGKVDNHGVNDAEISTDVNLRTTVLHIYGVPLECPRFRRIIPKSQQPLCSGSFAKALGTQRPARAARRIQRFGPGKL